MTLSLKYAIVILLCSNQLTRWVTLKTDRKGLELLSEYEPLPDVLFDIIPQIYFPYIGRVLDAFTIIPILACLSRLRYVHHPYAVPSKCIVTLAIVYIVRIVAFSVTILPSPNCVAGAPRVDAVGGCHDCIFSGHVSTALIVTLNTISIGGSIVWLAHPIVLSILLIATRMHYTIDIIVAWCFSVLAFTFSDKERMFFGE